MAENWKKNFCKKENLVYVIGCLLVVLASFMPYIYSEKKKWTLMEATDGVFFLVFTILIFIFLYYEKTKIAGILTICIVYFGAYELLHTFSVMRSDGGYIRLCAGYYVLLAGTVLLLAGAAYFVYMQFLKDRLGRLFDKIYAAKAEKKEKKEGKNDDKD